MSSAAAPVSCEGSSVGSRNLFLLSDFDREILRQAEAFGGFHNAHAHLCRANTLADKYLRHIGTTPLEASNLPLEVKQSLVGDLHTGEAYTEKDLRERGVRTLQTQEVFGVTRFDTNIDATPDLPGDGLLAIDVALELRKEFEGKIDVRIAPTPIFGFKKDLKHRLSRWQVFEAAARKCAAAGCGFISLLPEKDDYYPGTDPDGKVGFKHHIRMGLELAVELGVEAQFHLDQANDPNERGTERMLEMLEGLPQPKIAGHSGPTVWVIHMISPSAYDEERFARLLQWLRWLNVGVIVCPTAAFSMRQYRSITAPTHNSIARVLELIKCKVPIRIGTDNIADVFVPASNGDPLAEIAVSAANGVRLNQPSIWAKLASGTPLNNVDIATVGRTLYEDRKACCTRDPSWRSAVEIFESRR